MRAIGLIELWQNKAIVEYQNYVLFQKKIIGRSKIDQISIEMDDFSTKTIKQIMKRQRFN